MSAALSLVPPLNLRTSVAGPRARCERCAHEAPAGATPEAARAAARGFSVTAAGETLCTVCAALAEHSDDTLRTWSQYPRAVLLLAQYGMPTSVAQEPYASALCAHIEHAIPLVRASVSWLEVPHPTRGMRWLHLEVDCHGRRAFAAAQKERDGWSRFQDAQLIEIEATLGCAFEQFVRAASWAARGRDPLLPRQQVVLGRDASRASSRASAERVGVAEGRLLLDTLLGWITPVEHEGIALRTIAENGANLRTLAPPAPSVRWQRAYLRGLYRGARLEACAWIAARARARLQALEQAGARYVAALKSAWDTESADVWRSAVHDAERALERAHADCAELRTNEHREGAARRYRLLGAGLGARRGHGTATRILSLGVERITHALGLAIEAVTARPEPAEIEG